MVFSDGISLGPARCRVIVDNFIEGTSGELPVNSVILGWSLENGMTALKVDYPLTRIIASSSSDSEFFVSGRLGFIGLVQQDRVIEETIEGPQDEGFIRDLKAIGKYVYAAGMGRQVYRRAGPGNWQPFDNGLSHKSEDYLDIAGFNAIDGISEEDFYAVGFNGEIWHCIRDEWRQITSPTNVIIECVRAITPSLVYAAGQGGLLLRGHDDAWDVIEQGETADDFWGIEWFRGRLYLATSKGLFRLTDRDKIEQLDLGLPGPRSYSQLHASRGALWSFGRKHISWTGNGEEWNDVVMK